MTNYTQAQPADLLAPLLALVAKLPSLETLDAVDDDLRSGTRPCPLHKLTINDVRLLHAFAAQRVEERVCMECGTSYPDGKSCPGDHEAGRRGEVDGPIICELCPTEFHGDEELACNSNWVQNWDGWTCPAHTEHPPQAWPSLNIKCITSAGDGICGFTFLNVIRVEAEDDGSFTAVTDYWPQAQRFARRLGG